MNEPTAPAMGSDDTLPASIPEGSWAGPSALSDGHALGSSGGTPASVTPQQPGPAQPTPVAPGTPFDFQRFLAGLPAEDQAEYSKLSPAALERVAKRTMLQADYSRKRGAEAQELAQVNERMEVLRQQNLMAATLLEQLQGNGAGQPQAPSMDDLGKALYEAEDHEAYGKSLAEMIDQRVRAGVSDALENSPTLRGVRAGATLRSYRGSVPDVTAADVEQGRLALVARLKAQGADPSMFNAQSLEFMHQQDVETQRALRLLAQAKAGPAGAPAGTMPGPLHAFPVSGSGPTAPTVTHQDRPGFGEGSTLQSRMESTLRGFNMTPGDLARLLRESS